MVSRWEVDGFAGVTPPSGTASLVLAIVLLVTLILRPKGITAGKEIPWPGDWKLRRPRLRGAESSVEAPPAAPEPPPGTATD
jgi:hypothetical protein